MNRYQEYQICKKRNHQASDKTITNDDKGPWKICKFCGTWFRHITIKQEKNIPDEHV